MSFRIITCTLFFLAIYTAKSQIVLNNGIYVYLANGSSNTASTTLVLNNPPVPATATPIKLVGTSTTTGGTVLESEWNRIQYNLGTLTYSISIPFVSNATGSWVQFPLNFYSVVAGVGASGSMRFSSTHAGTMSTGWDNIGYMPSKVLNMNGAACAGDNSANAVDRFWIIEPVNYTTRPGATLDFTYIMGETNTNGGNTASLASLLQPQRYDTTAAAACAWNGFPTTPAEAGTNTPAGSITATSVGTLTGVQVSAAQFFPDWTLANYLVPLPVQIANFAGVCDNKSITLKWVSTNEINSNFYSIEKSLDGINFTLLTTVAAAGNSNRNINYTYIDVSPGDNSENYYRLSETDKNGSKRIFQTILATGCNSSANENATMYSHGNEVTINLYSLSNQNITITAYDVTGRLIYQDKIYAAEGNNNFKLTPDLAQGIYVFDLKTEKTSIVKRILIER